MSKGFVYILSNPSMPGLLKIGKTTRDVGQRASELWQTGVPTPFVVEREFYSPNCDELEARAHEEFSEFRVSQGREFFRSNPAEVELVLCKLLIRQVMEFVEEFTPDMALVHPDYIVDTIDLTKTVQSDDLHPAELAGALKLIKAEEISPLMDRYQHWVADRIAKVADRKLDVADIGDPIGPVQ